MEISINELRELAESNIKLDETNDELVSTIRTIVDIAVEDYTTTTDVESIIEKAFDKQSYVEESSDFVRRVESLLDDTEDVDFSVLNEMPNLDEWDTKIFSDDENSIESRLNSLTYTVFGDTAKSDGKQYVTEEYHGITPGQLCLVDTINELKATVKTQAELIQGVITALMNTTAQGDTGLKNELVELVARFK